jgi:hypothetical protein
MEFETAGIPIGAAVKIYNYGIRKVKRCYSLPSSLRPENIHLQTAFFWYSKREKW